MDRTSSSESLDNKESGSSSSDTKSVEISPTKNNPKLSETRKSLSNGSISYERLRSLKQMVDRAIKEHRIFSVAGPFPTIRQALRQRGWLEKMGTSATILHRRKRNSQNKQDEEGSKEKEPDPNMVARLLRNCAPDLLWAVRSDTVDWRSLARWQLVNRFPKALFTTKVGLSSALQHMQWFTEEGVSETVYPRSYCVSQPDEMIAFVSDFRLTACCSLLRQVIDKANSETNDSTSKEKNEEKQEVPVEPAPLPLAQKPQITLLQSVRRLYIPTKAITFAMNRCNEHLRHLRHEDVDDWNVPVAPGLGHCGPGEGRVWDCEWDQFLTFYYQLVHDEAAVAWETPQEKEELLKRANDILTQYVQLRPFSHHDGTLNLWIVKPGARSCGRGIQIMNRLESIISRTQPAIGKESRFVVQKYIERPLLIYNTKFDIRQWFLVTSAQPLTIWMYRESYLRFCSQLFDMRNLHESVHLSNNAVQCRYQNCHRDPALPDENMWDCYTFQTYLRSIGRAEAWEQKIYPGMRAGIIGTMLASQDWLDSQPNCFELYGADFMLSDGDLQPWLLEVNCSPCMAPSTSVTARLCAQCLEDVLRVVVDRRDDREASTGMFELVYRQNSSPAPPYQGVALGVKGRRMTPSRPKRRHRRGIKGAKEAASSSCSSACSQCSTDDDEYRLNLMAEHRVNLVSPLKVIKAEINAPLKPKPKTPIPMSSQILSSQQPFASNPLSASELRVRLERLLAQTSREKVIVAQQTASRSRSAHSRHEDATAAPPTNKASGAVIPIPKRHHKRTRKSSAKFKAKISGKNITYVHRESEIRFVRSASKESRTRKLATEGGRQKKDNNSNRNNATMKQDDSTNKETTQESNLSVENANNETTPSNPEPVPTLVREEQDYCCATENYLLFEPDNLRSSKFSVVPDAPDCCGEDECTADPGRSLALVKEWRRRLEATRASCEQMLAQLKAFRDPVKTSSVLTPSVMSSENVCDTYVSQNSAASCNLITKRMRKIAAKDNHLNKSTTMSPHHLATVSTS